MSRLELVTAEHRSVFPFYQRLMPFTYRHEELTDAGTYTHVTVGHQELGGVYSRGQDREAQKLASHWLPYVAVYDADAALAKAKSLGALPTSETFDFLDLGRLALIQDPTGAPLGLWQPKNVSRQVPSLWFELTTPHGERASAFYQAMFGWEVKQVDQGEFRYTLFSHEGEDVASMIVVPSRFKGVPSHWLTYFPVTKDVLGEVTDGGGRVFSPFKPGYSGWEQAICQDPAGAVFGLLLKPMAH
jgi:hypothetical protein